MLCPNANQELGCTWKGPLRDFEQHLPKQAVKDRDAKDSGRRCPFYPVSCEFCGVQTILRALPEHIASCADRPLPCALCGASFKRSELENHQSAECPRAIMRCPNGCGAQTERKQLAAHQAECPNVKVSCPYRRFGCLEESTAASLQRHCAESAASHLSLLCARVDQAERSCTALEATVASLSQSLARVQQAPPAPIIPRLFCFTLPSEATAIVLLSGLLQRLQSIDEQRSPVQPRQDGKGPDKAAAELPDQKEAKALKMRSRLNTLVLAEVADGRLTTVYGPHSPIAEIAGDLWCFEVPQLADNFDEKVQ